MGTSDRLTGDGDNQQLWSREVALDASLRDRIVNTIAARTARRYAAIYPINLNVLAVHDGEHVVTLSDARLRQRLKELLAGDRQVLWLVVDVRDGRCYRADPTSATSLLASFARGEPAE